MSYGVKKLLAVVTLVVIAFGWYVTIFGVGSVGPIKDQMKFGLDIKGGVYVVMEAQTNLTGADLKKLMEQTQAVIEARVNQLGLSEPVVTIEGEKRLRVELPGAADSDEAIKTIGQTAMLKFLLADGTFVLDGSMVKNAGVTQDNEHGGYAISLEFTSEGTTAFADATKKAYNGQVKSTTDGVRSDAIMIVLDGNIISAPSVNGPIDNGKALITAGGTGGFKQDEATRLAALIRGGALPVELKEITSSTRTATVGVDALQKSVYAGFIGLILIYVLMFIGYRIMGLAANIALTLYVILILWIMVLFKGVLTLPGIAGIILSIGMAVDANVIIFSRTREEITNGKTVRAAVDAGFHRAMNTVIDSHLTTIIAALVLYFAGTSSVRGFALTLLIGIVLSLFTAVIVTHLFISLFGESKLLSAKKFFGVRENNESIIRFKREFRFIKPRRIYYTISLVFIVVGLIIGIVRGYNLGIDFTGGTMMQFDMGKSVAAEDIDKVLQKNDVNAEIIFAGANNEQAIIKTMQSLDSDKREAILSDMESEFGISSDSLLAIDNFGPSVSNELRTNAIKAVLIAALGILLYIIVRFEWKFGVSAVLDIAHDVLFVMAFYAIFHITINNPFIAGILTVVGYSINDTIVIFDRIRENLGFMKKNKTEEVIDKSINQTLIRSIMTSVTVVVVMIPMLIMTSTAISEFVLPLMVGVIVGCVSSITVASPLFYEISQLSGGPRYKMKKSKKTARRSRDE